MSDEPIRLSKLMAQRGICSRREADAFIEKGLVIVDGHPVNQLGIKVSPDADVKLAPRAESQQTKLVTILLNKPVGYVSAQPEPGYTPAITLIKPGNMFGKSELRLKPSHFKGLAVAGRLDIDSQGLLIFTQDGRMAKRLVGEDHLIEKEYLVRVSGNLSNEGLALLRHGLELDGKPLLPAHVEWLNRDQLRFILKEGRKRQIRRMCEMMGLRITGLKRVRVGQIMLGNMPEGQWRFLGADESME